MTKYEKFAALAGIDIDAMKGVDENFAEKMHKFYKLVLADCVNVVAENTIKKKPTPIKSIFDLDY